MINFKAATKEELIAYIEQQENSNKKINKTTKLLTDLQELFNEYSENSTDNLLLLHFLLSVKYSHLAIPVLELLDKLDYEVEEEAIDKVVKVKVKELAKSDEFKLRKPNKKVVPGVVEVKEVKEVNTPL